MIHFVLQIINRAENKKKNVICLYLDQSSDRIPFNFKNSAIEINGRTKKAGSRFEYINMALAVKISYFFISSAINQAIVEIKNDIAIRWLIRG